MHNLKELVRTYETLSIDTQRTMARIKAIYRARGIRTPGRGVYQPKQRQQWLELLTETGIRQGVTWLDNWINLSRCGERRSR